MDKATVDMVRSVIEADGLVKKYLERAAEALQIGCNPIEVAESLLNTAAHIGESNARLEELLT